ncbi:MAG: sugar phosphate nucleotidyltransferase, partial [bacterium]
MSRKLYPKQLLPLVSARSMVQETALRVGDTSLFAPPFVVCNEDHRFMIAEQLREIGLTGATIFVEPVGRSTAAAIAVAAIQADAQEPDAILLILPADHLVQNREAFQAAVRRGSKVAAA